jgi:hypothetical protein
VQDDLEYKTMIVPAASDTTTTPYLTIYDEARNAFFVCARDVLAGNSTRGVFVMSKGGFDELRTEADYYAALKQSFPAPFTEVSEQLLLYHGLIHCAAEVTRLTTRHWQSL